LFVEELGVGYVAEQCAVDLVGWGDMLQVELLESHGFGMLLVEMGLATLSLVDYYVCVLRGCRMVSEIPVVVPGTCS
jgi:hypothetical protein